MTQRHTVQGTAFPQTLERDFFPKNGKQFHVIAGYSTSNIVLDVLDISGVIITTVQTTTDNKMFVELPNNTTHIRFPAGVYSFTFFLQRKDVE